MPVSHLGLTVSHIPSATSFYLAALQPLGYRFIGHQGDSIGLGIESADFFLTQSPLQSRPSPTHIAFSAESRLIVRDCYAAALTSGGSPSGPPSYRNNDCSCFNAAVEDLDGNTIEFIYRQAHDQAGCCKEPASTEGSRVRDWQKDVAKSAMEDDAPSVAPSKASKGSLASEASRRKSHIQTALDLASSTSKNIKSAAADHGLSQISTASAKSDFPSKTLIGTALGAAAGAALMYAVTKAEGDNAKDEAEYQAYMSSKARRRRSIDERRLPSAKSEAIQYAESTSSQRQPPSQARAMRMIEATAHNRDDDYVQEAMSRHTTLRPKAARSRTYDDYEYAAPSNNARSVAASEFGMKRATTMPLDTGRTKYYLEAGPAQSASRYEEPPRSSVSHSSRHSFRHRSRGSEDRKMKRQDSGISVSSHRSHRNRESESERRHSGSKASTIKPIAQEYEKSSARQPETSSKAKSKAPSSCYYPAAISLPSSKASSRVERSVQDRSQAGISRAPTYLQDIPREPLVPSKESWEDFVAEESDGLGDTQTVFPEDSISMIGTTKSRRRRHSKTSSRKSEASTVRPVKERSSRSERHERRSERA